MRTKALRAAIGIFALVGASIAAYLTYARYTQATIACTTGGCEAVQSSDYAELAGVPVAVLGLVAYVVLFLSSLSAAEVARTTGAAVAVAAAAFSAYLVYVQIAVIDAICQWCVASDILMPALATLCVMRLFQETNRAR